MAATIRAMTDGIAGLGEATSQLIAVAGEQQATAQRLDLCVEGAIERIQSMSSLTERLDRRSSARVSVSGTVRVTLANQAHDLTLMDVSEGGARCLIRSDIQLPLGAVAAIDLGLGGVNESLRARVVRRDAGVDGDDLGLEFLDISDRARGQVRQFVDALLSGEAGQPSGA